MMMGNNLCDAYHNYPALDVGHANQPDAHVPSLLSRLTEIDTHKHKLPERLTSQQPFGWINVLVLN